MVEGDEAVALAKHFWSMGRTYGGGVSGDWHLGTSIHGPGIPLSKFNNFCTKAGCLTEGFRALLYCDATVFGSGKEGVLLTDRKMYIHCPDDGKIWNIALPSIRVVLELDASDSSGKLTMNDKARSVSFASRSQARTVKLFLEYMQSPETIALEHALKRIWQPAECNSLLAEIKALGIKDEFLTPLVDEVGRLEKILSHGGGLVFTNRWIISAEAGPFRRDSVSLLVKQDEHSTQGLTNHYLSAMRHPSVFHIVMAGLDTLIHFSQDHTYTVYLKTSTQETPIAQKCNHIVMEKVKVAAEASGLPLTVPKH